MDVGFSDLYAEVLPDIEKWSRYSVPGMGQNEVRCEVEYSLWKAWRSYDQTSEVKFHVYWHIVWMNHKSHLIEAFFRIKRRSEVVFDPFDLQELTSIYNLDRDALVPLCPSDNEEVRRIWFLLALGSSAVAVRRTLGISRRRYDDLVATLRRPSVRAAIVP